MSLPKRQDIYVRVSEDSERIRHWSTKVGLTSRADRAEITSDKSLPTRLTFLEDFTLEHSLGGTRITAIESAAIIRP